MFLDQLHDYCIYKPAVTEHFPFNEDVLVFKVLEKMFLLTSLKSWEQGETAISLKCNPDYALELRETYQSIEPGYHMNKKHWITLHLFKNEIPSKLVKQLIDDSYNLVLNSLSKKLRDTID